MNYYKINNKVVNTEADLFATNGFEPLSLTTDQIAFWETYPNAFYDEVIAMQLTQVPQPTKEQITDQIYKNYEAAETSNLTPAGAIQLSEWCLAGNTKALAVRQWLVDLYAERDAKLDLVDAGDLTVNVNPTAPTKPYSFREMKLN